MQIALRNDPKEVVESAQCGPFVVVWKSMDEVHYPGKDRRTFRFRLRPVKGSIIIDEIIRSQLCERFVKRHASMTPRQLMLELNDCIYAFQASEGLPLNQADELCGVRMVVAKDCGDYFDIAYVGDCFALAESNSGFNITGNQAYRYNCGMYDMIEKCWDAAALRLRLNPASVEQGTDQWDKVRLEMWREFGPYLESQRRLHINNPDSNLGHGVLNGQPNVKAMIRETPIPKKNLWYLLLGNNGCIPWDMEKDIRGVEVARKLMGAVHQAQNLDGALDAVIAQAREYEKNTKISHARGGRADAACAIIKP